MKQANQTNVKRGDTVWVKATVRDIWGNALDLSVKDISGVEDWIYEVPKENVLVEEVSEHEEA